MDWEVNLKLWVKDTDEEDVARMAQEIANGLEETMKLEKAFHGVPDSESSGLLNVTYQQAFYHRTGTEEE